MSMANLARAGNLLAEAGIGGIPAQRNGPKPKAGDKKALLDSVGMDEYTVLNNLANIAREAEEEKLRYEANKTLLAFHGWKAENEKPALELKINIVNAQGTDLMNMFTPNAIERVIEINASE